MATKKTQRNDARYRITVTSYRARRHDPDGVSVKGILDGLVQRGILPDDSTKEISQVTFKSYISKEVKTIIEIEAA